MLEGTLSGDTYTTTAKYVWEGNSYYDPLLFALEGGAWKHPMSDGLGSTRQLLDNANQTVTDEYAYEAFGNLMSSTGSTPNPYKYVGSLGYYQTGSSLQHLGARHYMPEIGRFTSADPLAEATRSAYPYVDNSPVSHRDPRGLRKRSCEEIRDEWRRVADADLGNCLDGATAWGVAETAGCTVTCTAGCKKWAGPLFRRCMLYCVPACETLVAAHVYIMRKECRKTWLAQTKAIDEWYRKCKRQRECDDHGTPV